MPYKNPEHKKLRRQLYNPGYKQRPEVKERERLWMREWRKNNPERHKIISAKSREKHKDKIYQKTKEWKLANKERVYFLNKQREYRLRNAVGKFTFAEWEKLQALFAFCCACCRLPEPLTIDHIVPLSKGGSNTIDNIQPLCRSCNSKKNTAIIDYRKAA